MIVTIKNKPTVFSLELLHRVEEGGAYDIRFSSDERDWSTAVVSTPGTDIQRYTHFDLGTLEIEKGQYSYEVWTVGSPARLSAVGRMVVIGDGEEEGQTSQDPFYQ